MFYIMHKYKGASAHQLRQKIPHLQSRRPLTVGKFILYKKSERFNPATTKRYICVKE